MFLLRILLLIVLIGLIVYINNKKQTLSRNYRWLLIAAIICIIIIEIVTSSVATSFLQGLMDGLTQ